MNTLAGGQTYAIANRFDKAVKLIRSALAKTELGVVGELDTTGTFGKEPGKKAERSSILLVDCPLIVFEAQALDRAAGVFFPLHVLILADGGQTWACTASAAGILNARLPSGADGPMERLQARVAVALESVSLRAGPNHPEQIGEE
jgi:uncharacterized protein (DUF302 family)